MNCVEVSDNLTYAVDNRLNGYDRIYFFEHISQCADCKREYESQLLIKKLLREKTVRNEVPQELMNFLRMIPDQSNSNHEHFHSSDLKSPGDSGQHKINLLVWGLITTGIFIVSVFYIMNLK